MRKDFGECFVSLCIVITTASFLFALVGGFMYLVEKIMERITHGA